MSDTASLEIKVEPDGVDTTNKQLDELEKRGKGASRASDGLTASFKKMIVPLVSVATLMKTLHSAVDVQRRYDVLSSTLQTVTGSAEGAAEVFKVLQQYADETPFAIENLNEAFIKLVNFGLDPGERALTSYGNTATSMGRDITDMVNAVANATTGNFESLKSFGIQSKNMGDTVAFSFQGTTTTIKNSTEEIEEYLLRLGENEFAGAMANSLGKLDDTILALGEQWDTLLLNIMQAGVGSAIQDSIQVAVDALVELNAMFASGEVGAYLDSMAVQFEDWGRDIATTVDILTNLLRDNFGEWEEDGSGAISFLTEAFSKFPSNVRAFIQIMTVEVASGFDKLVAFSIAFKSTIKSIFNDDKLVDIGTKFAKEVAIAETARRSSIESILAERDASVKASDDMIAKAKELRKLYDEEMAREKGDRLSKYKIKGADSGDGGGDSKAAKRQQDEFQRLVESLRSEEEAIEDSYNKRRAIIELNTAQGSELRADLMSRLDADHAEQLEKFNEAQGAELEGLRRSLLTQEEAIKESYDRRLQIIQDNTAEGSAHRDELSAKLQTEYDSQLNQLEEAKSRERDSLYNGLLTEEEMLLQSYERRKAMILESTAVTEEERLDLSKRLEDQYSSEMAEMENKRLQTQLSNAAALFDGLSGLAKAYGGEQSKAYKVLFAISKAFSVAQAAMSISTGLAKAQELGWPANLAEMARVGATGASILSQISGSNFSGAYDLGGNIPAGKIGLVGEYGPELINGPARVTGRRKTAEELSKGGSGVSVVVNNNAPVSVRTESSHTSDGERLEFIIEETKKALTSDIMSGDGSMPRALEGTYGSLRRGQL